MSKKITDKTFVVLLHSDVRVWISREQRDNIRKLRREGAQCYEVDDIDVKESSIAAILPASEIDDLDNRKRGKWQCERGVWHARNDQCDCISLEEEKEIRERRKIIEACDKCDRHGIIQKGDTVLYCDHA